MAVPLRYVTFSDLRMKSTARMAFGHYFGDGRDVGSLVVGPGVERLKEAARYRLRALP